MPHPVTVTAQAARPVEERSVVEGAAGTQENRVRTSSSAWLEETPAAEALLGSPFPFFCQKIEIAELCNLRTSPNFQENESNF